MENVMATVKYVGDLRTEAMHLKSGKMIFTDAPTDNQGKGEAFSPTDLVSAALCSCMMTIMGQVANREAIDIKGLKANVVKVMSASPRKIAEVKITFSHTKLEATDVQKQKLKNAAMTCPVALSLSESVRQTINFEW